MNAYNSFIKEKLGIIATESIIILIGYGDSIEDIAGKIMRYKDYDFKKEQLVKLLTELLNERYPFEHNDFWFNAMGCPENFEQIELNTQ